MRLLLDEVQFQNVQTSLILYNILLVMLYQERNVQKCIVILPQLFTLHDVLQSDAI